ncbi:G-type lectin S-receptor-like serine/threonine-protein kinase At4g27290 isoform X1 [Bidens hawaiensis]|uniref:G-type lectin S-receptor-like serine/threonine-protein kinase At4g27290 isoform X1 n=1 Tax=Bidens hawaiensis TaxID=980011 RepID=UPI00404AE1A2
MRPSFPRMQEAFEFGFFCPGNSTNHYVGIWYKKISKRTYVWVANRNTPLTDTSGELTLTLKEVLILRNASTGNVIWSSGNSSSAMLVINPIGQLLDTGNFIIQEEGKDINKEYHLWQSFDFITDTLLCGMKLGRDLVTGIERHLMSWKSDDGPALGEFTSGIDTNGYHQLFVWHEKEIKFRGGSWNGVRFTGVYNMRPNRFHNFTFVLNQREIYYQFDLIDISFITRLVLQPNGSMEHFLWIESRQDWSPFLGQKAEICDLYAVCGQFRSCNFDKSPSCECFKGFEPTSPDQWKVTDWTQGCRHSIPLDCNPGEGFNKLSNLKLPDTGESWYDQTMTLVECEKKCKSNCSCTAYTYTDISGSGSGCLLWFGGLMDIRMVAENGDTLYVRLSASELYSTEDGKSETSGIRIQVIVPVASVVLVILLSICLFYGYNRKKQQEGTGSDDEDLELPLFGLSTILKATNNFSVNKKLGEGGFGPVYKGILENGKQIAVKRLANTSTQGLHEFKN